MAEFAELKVLSGVIIAMTSSDKFKKHQNMLRKRTRMILRYIRRRQRKISLLVFLMCEYLRNQARERRFWIEPSRGKTQFWEETVSQWKDDTLWLENFRLSKRIFSLYLPQIKRYTKEEGYKIQEIHNCRKAFSHLFLASCYWGRSAFPWLEIWYRKKHRLPDSKRSLPGYCRCAFTGCNQMAQWR